jgi:hypothetical protein
MEVALRKEALKNADLAHKEPYKEPWPDPTTPHLFFALLHILVVLVIWMVHQIELPNAFLDANLKNDGQGKHSVCRIMVRVPVFLVIIPRASPAGFAVSSI